MSTRWETGPDRPLAPRLERPTCSQQDWKASLSPPGSGPSCLITAYLLISGN